MLLTFYCNSYVLLQMLWLHMLYAAIGAIVFTMVSAFKISVLSVYYPVI